MAQAWITKGASKVKAVALMTMCNSHHNQLAWYAASIIIFTVKAMGMKRRSTGPAARQMWMVRRRQTAKAVNGHERAPHLLSDRVSVAFSGCHPVMPHF
jgi:hypothetical protein